MLFEETFKLTSLNKATTACSDCMNGASVAIRKPCTSLSRDLL